MRRQAPSVIETAKFLLANPWSTERQVRHHLVEVLDVPDRRIRCVRGENLSEREYDLMVKGAYDTAYTETFREGNECMPEVCYRRHQRNYIDSATGHTYEVTCNGQSVRGKPFSWYEMVYHIIPFDGTNHSDFPHVGKVLDPHYSIHVKGDRWRHSGKDLRAVHFEHDGGFPRRWMVTATGIELAFARPTSPDSKRAWPYRDRSKHV